MRDPLLGTLVGNYRIVDVLGEGGMGKVYRATHPELDRTVAVKVLALGFASSEEIVRRFRVEARAVNKIKHPNVVDVQDFGTLPDGRPYCLMEYLAGESLGGYLERVGVLNARDCIAIMLPVTEALEAAHLAGVVHRDLKPDNIFLVAQPNRSPIPKLLDFGIAKVLSETVAGTDQRHTRAGQLMGTPVYMSPEQAAGRVEELGTPSDVYSLGIILYQMLCGQPPFDSPAFGELLAMHMQTPPPSLAARAPQVPVVLETLVMRMLSKAPGDRPVDAGQVRRELLAIADQLALSASGPLERSPFAPTIMASAASGALAASGARPPGGTYPSGVSGEVGKARTVNSKPRPVLAIAAGAIVLVAAVAIVAVARFGGSDAPAPSAQPAQQPASQPPAAFDAAVVPVQAPIDAPVDAAIDAAIDAPVDAAESELERRLRLLKQLFDEGKMSQAEYDTRRKKILEEWMPQ